jgi:FtsH-binding integral membrane protein
MRRVGRKAMLVFVGYAALLLAVVIAGFIGREVGSWASILWGAVLIAGLVLYGRQRLRQPQVDS